jgi:hypothetical protein
MSLTCVRHEYDPALELLIHTCAGVARPDRSPVTGGSIPRRQRIASPPLVFLRVPAGSGDFLLRPSRVASS